MQLTFSSFAHFFRKACFFSMSLCSLQSVAMDCQRVRLPLEKIICADTLLKRLDEALNINYDGMMASNIGDDARRALRQEQRDWVRQRNACKDYNCLVTLYRERVDSVCETPVISGVHAICETTQAVEDDLAGLRDKSQFSPYNRPLR